jgi:hypothetical protein
LRKKAKDRRKVAEKRRRLRVKKHPWKAETDPRSLLKVEKTPKLPQQAVMGPRHPLKAARNLKRL